jgi:hypothetical protein
MATPCLFWGYGLMICFVFVVVVLGVSFFFARFVVGVVV